jgi:hypothetical protein
MAVGYHMMAAMLRSARRFAVSFFERTYPLVRALYPNA